MCPCVGRVWVKGDIHSLLRTLEGGAQPGGSIGWVQAQLPCQILSCRCQHASTVGLGGSLEAVGGVTWLPAGCTSRLSPCSIAHRSVLEPGFSTCTSQSGADSFSSHSSAPYWGTHPATGAPRVGRLHTGASTSASAAAAAPSIPPWARCGAQMQQHRPVWSGIALPEHAQSTRCSRHAAAGDSTHGMPEAAVEPALNRAAPGRAGPHSHAWPRDPAVSRLSACSRWGKTWHQQPLGLQKG